MRASRNLRVPRLEADHGVEGDRLRRRIHEQHRFDANPKLLDSVLGIFHGNQADIGQPRLEHFHGGENLPQQFGLTRDRSHRVLRKVRQSVDVSGAVDFLHRLVGLFKNAACVEQPLQVALHGSLQQAHRLRASERSFRLRCGFAVDQAVQNRERNRDVAKGSRHLAYPALRARTGSSRQMRSKSFFFSLSSSRTLLLMRMIVARAAATISLSSQLSNLCSSIAAERSSSSGCAIVSLPAATQSSTSCMVRSNRPRPERCRAISLRMISKAFSGWPAFNVSCASAYASAVLSNHEDEPCPLVDATAASAAGGFSAGVAVAAAGVPSCWSHARVSPLAAGVSSSRTASNNCGVSCSRAFSSERIAAAIGSYSSPRAVHAPTTSRCKSSHARLHGSDMAFSAVSRSSLHFFASASRFTCCRNSVVGASSSLASLMPFPPRSSPQRRPRIIK